MSTGRISPVAKQPIASPRSSGTPRLRAKRFMVPAGSTASAVLLPARAPAAADTVPSPPPAISTSKSSRAAACSSAASISSPATAVTRISCPACCSDCFSCAANASRSSVRRLPPSRFSTAVKRMAAASRRAIAGNGLDLQIFGEAELALFAAIARLPVAAEGQADIPFRIVDIDRAGAQPPRHPPRPRNIPCLHIGGEAVHRIVGQLDRLLLAVMRQDRQNRAEDLLAGNAHFRPHIGEDGRAHEPAARKPRRPARTAG